MLFFIHFIIWCLGIHLFFDIPGLIDYLFSLNKDEKVMEYAFLIFPFAIALFYWNTLYLGKKHFRQAKKKKYFFYLALSFTAIILINSSLFYFFKVKHYEFTMFEELFIDYNLMFILICLSVSTLLNINKESRFLRKQKKLATQKQKETELKLINTQFAPHFLFNALNAIYAISIDEEAIQTSEATLTLSDLLRYPISEGGKGKVKLEKEVAFIDDYIKFQKIKLGENYPIFFEKNITHINRWEISPLIFINLVENAFKYGVSHHKKTKLFFKLEVSQNEITFNTENFIVKEKELPSFKKGLENLRERLEVTYPKQYSLNRVESYNIYKVELKISQSSS